MIKIGDIALANNIAIAPMSGVSDLPFRVEAAAGGAGLVVSEMVASAELAKARPDVVRRAEGDASVFPFAIQLAGCSPQWMAEGARLAEAAGADIIDINMGCPSRQVTGVLSGSALMREPELALSLIDATVKATSRPVTLKMRLGWDRDMLNAPFFAAEAEARGVQMITVHGRTRNQFYKGAADWRAVAATKTATNLPVIVNGDIHSLADARMALAQSGADGVMIGRATIGRPWLGGAIARAMETGADDIVTPGLKAQVASMLRQYRAALQLYGERLGVRIARKHLSAFADHAPVDLSDASRRALRASLCTSADPLVVIGALESLAASEKIARASAA